MADKRCDNGHFIDESGDICPYCPQDASEPEIAAAAWAHAPRRRHWAVVGNGLNRIAASELRIKLSELCYKSIACDVTDESSCRAAIGEAESKAQRIVLDAMQRSKVYPHNPKGELASIFIVESEKGIANSREITRERPTVAIPGPGTLSRVYKRDMAKVENAIQTQLASCKEFNVPCGITANAGDVAKRIKEGFRMIVIYDRDYPETMKAAREAAGRE